MMINWHGVDARNFSAPREVSALLMVIEICLIFLK
jgi:hypothetical protein